MDALLNKGPRSGPLGFLVGAYAVVWGADRIASDPGLRRLAIWPLALTVTLYLVFLTLVTMFAGDLVVSVLPEVPDGFWGTLVWWVVTILLLGVTFLVLVLLFSTVAEAIGGAFYDRMAIRILHGHNIATREPGFIESTFPDLLRSLMFVFATMVFAVLGLIPVIGIVFVVLATGVAWLGFASAAVNPSLLVTEHNLSDRLEWLRTHLSTSLGIGAVVAAAMLVPLLGLLAIPASIVGAAELHARDRVRRSEGTGGGGHPIDGGPER